MTAIRNDNSIKIIINNIENYKTREEIRTFLLYKWASEARYKKYRYFVETLNDSSHLYLERPGKLNKGCDFVIYIGEQWLYKNGNDRPPSHELLMDDLSNKKNILSKQDFNSLKKAISEIYACKPYNEASKHIKHLSNIKGYSYELLLKLIRWFFIEQDITYWSGKGREMLFEEIKNI